MILISIFLILLLLGATLWLWYLSQAQFTHLDVLMTESSMTVSRFVNKLSFSHTKEAVSLLRLRRFKREEAWVVEAVQTLQPDGTVTIHRKRITSDSEQREQVTGDTPSLREEEQAHQVEEERRRLAEEEEPGRKMEEERRRLAEEERRRLAEEERQRRAEEERVRKALEVEPPSEEKHLRSDLAPLTARYSGTANLPKKVYEGSSQNITLILSRKGFVQGLHPEVSHVQEITKNKQTEQQITLDIQEKDSSEQFLEVRLLAAAFPTKGEEKQRQSLTRERLEYRWNCYFQTAGRHELALELKVVHLSEERPLGVIEQQIKVVKLDHMTQLHVRAAAVLLGTIGLMSTVVTIISNILKLKIP